MKMKTLVAAAVTAFLATSMSYAAPSTMLVDDNTNSTSMQQSTSDPMAMAQAQSSQPSDPSSSMQSQQTAPSASDQGSNGGSAGPMAMAPSNIGGMDPQSGSSSANGSNNDDLSADTATGDDDY